MDRTAEGWSWRLVSRTVCAADLIARSGEARTDRAEALHELALLGDGPVPRLVGSRDGHWQWLVPAPDGTVAALSPAVYRDPAACREAFTDARRAAVTVLRRDRRREGARSSGGMAPTGRADGTKAG